MLRGLDLLRWVTNQTLELVNKRPSYWKYDALKNQNNEIINNIMNQLSVCSWKCNFNLKQTFKLLYNAFKILFVSNLHYYWHIWVVLVAFISRFYQLRTFCIYRTHVMNGLLCIALWHFWPPLILHVLYMHCILYIHKVNAWMCVIMFQMVEQI